MSDSDNQGLQAGFAKEVDGPPEGIDSRVDQARESDTEIDRRARTDVTWDTSLPRAMRESMRSRQRGNLPRGYEDRLKQYFENLD